jgi:hypothetical protein
MVTTEPCTASAVALAEYFKVHLDVVKDEAEYAVRLFDRLHVGVRDIARVSDSAVAEIANAANNAQKAPTTQ